jgi:hypothetical protein
MMVITLSDVAGVFVGGICVGAIAVIYILAKVK